MSRSSKWRRGLSTATAALGTLLLSGVAASAAPAPVAGLRADSHETGAHQHPATAAEAVPNDSVFLAANLNGRNEISSTGTPAAGDLDGRARVVVRIQGTQVCFKISWSGIAPPTAAHIHVGAAGGNGGIVVGFFAGALPTTLRSVVGCATGTAEQLTAIKANPAGFYANVHNAEFPPGAVRGQLHVLDAPADLLGDLRGPLVALADGTQEVPDLGDVDGRGTAFVRAHGTRVSFAATWSGIAPPAVAHIHPGRVGQPGGVVVGLFAGAAVGTPPAPAPLPASIFGVTGLVEGANAAAVRAINRRPGNYYANLHNAEFPAGAIRGQLFRAGGAPTSARTFTAPVRRGVQIYACTARPGGTFGFVLTDVRATLHGNIRHSFVAAGGPPQWVAPDGSAVTGRVLGRTPAGTGNADEVEFDATQSGDGTGRLAAAVEVLQVNTVGGGVPPGACDPAVQPRVEIPYKADYVFIAD